MARLLSFLLAALLACASAPARDATSAIPAAPPLSPELAAIVPPPPAAASDDARSELAIVLWEQRTRTPTEVERAKLGAGLGLEAYAAALGPGFDPAKHPKTRALLAEARKRARAPLHAAKDHYARKRPYDTDPRVVPAVDREPSAAYPSGHATYGIVLARTLAELAPARRDALLQAGATIGYDRVIGGVHWPSDVLAGQKLGAALADRILADPEFRRMVDEVRRAEW